MIRPRKRLPPGVKPDESFLRIEAARDSVSRKFIAAYRCWKFCGDRNCLRARACTGDVQACFLFFWKFLPEQDRAWILTAVRGERKGMSKEEAIGAADATIAPAAGEPISETPS